MEITDAKYSGKNLKAGFTASENVQIARLPEACLKKIHEFERELNKEGFWNIALVAYQMKN